MAQNYPKWPKNDAGIYALFRNFFFTEKAAPQTFSLLECMFPRKVNKTVDRSSRYNYTQTSIHIEQHVKVHLHPVDNWTQQHFFFRKSEHVDENRELLTHPPPDDI